VVIAPKPELTRAAENYLALYRHAVVRAELLSHTGIALRLAVAHLIAGSPLWNVKPDPQRADKEAIAGSVAASRPHAAFEAERKPFCNCWTWSRAISARSRAAMETRSGARPCLPSCWSCQTRRCCRC
jgi:hypothetical protein